MRLAYDPRALSDLAIIHRYIARSDAAAAGRVVARIRRAIDRLRVLPFSGGPGPLGIRLLAVPNLPYIVVHRVRENDGIVDVIAVLHTARERRE
ncbi:MAG: type II toxin-antitoxin system RelE/ParE family toxin [Pseudorhodoplanes sp.]|nr:hypothetical protein [Pseudorhodoplanes sp.]MBW7950244.1 type II toxin-antitoxin system RelE/ParE family toxin [Pseudorhodoplanes sp.]MCQ3942625.1 type II toxin-antitoxin system RelE/ParE family toxin [Alphaproteobacteria bacterium]